jgi:opacity protein-like surface antigen
LAPFMLDRESSRRAVAGSQRTESVMRKRLRAIGLACASAAVFTVLAAARAEAQVTIVEPSQSIGFTLGYFSVRGEDSRVLEDVLLADLSDLVFEVKDFNGASIGGEWLFGVSDYLEAGAGVGFYQRTVPSVYRCCVDEDGTEIEQDLKLRTVPLSATVRFLPIGRGGVEPYVGAGIGLINWRYSETGEFIDNRDDSIFRARFTDSGNAIGPVILGGIRLPVADTWLIGGELRYQKAEADLDPEAELLGEKIDLGGWTTSFTLHLRF